MLSPKVQKAENKLLDSLDSVAYQTTNNKPNIILLGDKRLNLKFKRAGSDDKPKNTTENKRTSNFKGNTTGSGLGLTANTSIPFKDKDRKCASKPSVDRMQFKSNKDANGVYSTLSSKLDLVKIDVSGNVNNNNASKYNSRLANKKK